MNPGLILLVLMLGSVAYAIGQYVAAERRHARRERLLDEWLADPTDVEKYRRWLRGGR